MHTTLYQGSDGGPPGQQLTLRANRPDSCLSADVKSTNLRTRSSVCQHRGMSAPTGKSPEQELLDSVIQEDVGKPSSY